MSFNFPTQSIDVVLHACQWGNVEAIDMLMDFCSQVYTIPEVFCGYYQSPSSRCNIYTYIQFLNIYFSTQHTYIYLYMYVYFLCHHNLYIIVCINLLKGLLLKLLGDGHEDIDWFEKELS